MSKLCYLGTSMLTSSILWKNANQPRFCLQHKARDFTQRVTAIFGTLDKEKKVRVKISTFRQVGFLVAGPTE